MWEGVGGHVMGYVRGCIMSCGVVCYVVPSIARADVPNRDGLRLGLELSQCHRMCRVVWCVRGCDIV